jgi:hypothetical protein
MKEIGVKTAVILDYDDVHRQQCSTNVTLAYNCTSSCMQPRARASLLT